MSTPSEQMRHPPLPPRPALTYPHTTHGLVNPSLSPQGPCSLSSHAAPQPSQPRPELMPLPGGTPGEK